MTVTASGKILKPVLIFKGAQNGRIVQREFPNYGNDMIYLCQPNAWMDEEAMIIWVDQLPCPYIETAPAGVLPILFLDSYRCHMMASVVDMIQDFGVKVEHIPGGCTSLCQPVDIGVNKPFKNQIRQQWEQWMIAEGLATDGAKCLEAWQYSWFPPAPAAEPAIVHAEEAEPAVSEEIEVEEESEDNFSATEGAWVISCATYLKECARRIESDPDLDGELWPHRTPIPEGCHPELDDGTFLSELGIGKFQMLIGMAQWAVTIGRLDISFAVSSLSRFSAAPREHHLELAYYLFGYLKKYPNHRIVVDSRPLLVNQELQSESFHPDFLED